MFNNLGLGEVIFLVVLALFVFGPERLPKAAADAGRMLRQLRQLAQNASADVRNELGPEFADVDLRSLHPRTFVQKHLFEDDDEVVPPRPGTRPLRPGERPPYDVDAT